VRLSVNGAERICSLWASDLPRGLLAQTITNQAGLPLARYDGATQTAAQVRPSGKPARFARFPTSAIRIRTQKPSGVAAASAGKWEWEWMSASGARQVGRQLAPRVSHVPGATSTLRSPEASAALPLAGGPRGCGRVQPMGRQQLIGSRRHLVSTTSAPPRGPLRPLPAAS